MLTNDQLRRLSPLATRFRELFLQQLGRVAFVEELTDCYELVILPAHPEVGELRVRDDGDELTISVGLHPWHVPLHLHGEALEAERPSLAAETAFTSVRDVLEERTIIRITHRDGRLTSTQSYAIGHPGVRPPTGDDTEFTWRGPRAGFLGPAV